MRHGEASQTAPNDVERNLTFQGQQQCRLVAKWLHLQSISIDYALVSPYKRAQQTFEVMRSDIRCLGRFETSTMVTPSASPRNARDYLYDLAQKKMRSALVVSHLPFVGYLVNELCQGIEPPMFATSAIACVSLDPETLAGKFEWMHN